MEDECRKVSWRPAVHRIAQRLAERLAAVRAEDPLGEAAYAAVSAALDEALADLQRLDIPPDQRGGMPAALWSVAGDWLRRGWLQTRAYAKPRGYAGDYELLAWIFEQRVSPDPLGRLLDRYFQEQAAPQAVRHRMTLLSGWVRDAATAAAFRAVRPARVPTAADAWADPWPHGSAGGEHPMRVAVLGSVTGLEIRQALQELPPAGRNRLEIILLDYDPEALACARDILTGWLSPAQLVTAQVNLARLPRRAENWAYAPCALLVVPGLLDYLEDAAAAELVAWGSRQLGPGGRLVLFQFAPHHPTRPYMEWIGDWRLVYRDRAGLTALARRAGLREGTFQIDAEPLGIILYLSVTRPAA